ncbi:MAG: hypothetical protein AAF353_13540, partial [Pseudomonadota bacterium]
MSVSTEHNDQQSHNVFQISSNGVTDTGHVRSKNEDSILVLADENVWIVADGMGRHRRLVAQTLARFELLDLVNLHFLGV